jgi:hypothetical protein
MQCTSHCQASGWIHRFLTDMVTTDLENQNKWHTEKWHSCSVFVLSKLTWVMYMDGISYIDVSHTVANFWLKLRPKTSVNISTLYTRWRNSSNENSISCCIRLQTESPEIFSAVSLTLTSIFNEHFNWLKWKCFEDFMLNILLDDKDYLSSSIHYCKLVQANISSVWWYMHKFGNDTRCCILYNSRLPFDMPMGTTLII